MDYSRANQYYRDYYSDTYNERNNYFPITENGDDRTTIIETTYNARDVVDDDGTASLRTHGFGLVQSRAFADLVAATTTAAADSEDDAVDWTDREQLGRRVLPVAREILQQAYNNCDDTSNKIADVIFWNQ